ncbi:MAG: hypothetical protein LBT87_07365 [Treponema sp.]|nr:hypothetical protein [Treponema sp.]
MDTILPFSVTYQVSALVGNASLENYSVIGKDDAVQPVFISPVLNDPDLTGLLVYLRSPEEEMVGEKVYYLLKTAEDPMAPSQSPAEDPSSWSPAWEETQDPVESENSETAEDTQEKEEEPEKTGNEIVDPTKERETLIHVSRLDRSLPAFPFPEDLKIGDYFLVFEVLGEKQTLYRTERRICYIGDAEFTLGDIQSYLPGLSAGSFLIPPGLSVMLETQVAADERLDPYIVWYDGRRRIAEGRIADGTGRLLWEASAQTGFHTIRAEVFPFSPTGVSFGTGNFRTGDRASVSELRGKVKELALPVSVKGGKGGLSAPEGKVLYWYQFAGNLRDSMANGSRGKDLTGSGAKNLHWVPSEGIYGLSLKAGNTCQPPRSFFAMNEEKQGGASFLLRVKPVAEGTLFTASFKAAGSAGDALTMSVVYREQSLQLNLESEGSRALGSLPLDMYLEDSAGSSAGPSLKDFIAVEAGFYVRENVFTAALSVEGDGKFGEGTMLPGLFRADSPEDPEDFPVNSVEIELPYPLSGEISCSLGSSQVSPPPARESRSLGAENSLEETASSAEAVAPAGAEDPAPAEASGLSSAGAPAERDPSQAVPYPLAIFDEFALVSRFPSLVR